jgi:D-sedoheptulose 7-phosphate isomerase
MKNFVTHYLDDLGNALKQLDPAAIATAIEWLRETRDRDGTIYICGNGGSASIASQMVVDIVKGGSYGKKKRIKMIGLTDSVATITAYGNDVSYDSVFVEPLKNFARAGDVLIAISGSGNSPNVLRAVEYANSVDCRTIGLTTGEGGKLREIAKLGLLVPSKHMGRLEDSFFIMTHILAYAFMEGD